MRLRRRMPRMHNTLLLLIFFATDPQSAARLPPQGLSSLLYSTLSLFLRQGKITREVFPHHPNSSLFSHPPAKEPQAAKCFLGALSQNDLFSPLYHRQSQTTTRRESAKACELPVPEAQDLLESSPLPSLRYRPNFLE